MPCKTCSNAFAGLLVAVAAAACACGLAPPELTSALIGIAAAASGFRFTPALAGTPDGVSPLEGPHIGFDARPTLRFIRGVPEPGARRAGIRAGRTASLPAVAIPRGAR